MNKLWIRLFAAAMVIVMAASCTKEDVKFKKMPDNGSTQIDCTPTGK